MGTLSNCYADCCICEYFLWTIFFFDALGNYIHGPAYYTMYVYAGVMSICLGIINVYYRKVIAPYKQRAVWEILFISASCVLIQALNTNISFTGFGIGLALASMMYTINNPYSQTDNLTGKLDQSSMMLYVKDLIRKKQPFHVISINVTQLRQINIIFGSKTGDELILHVIHQLDTVIKQPIFRSDGKRFAIIFDNRNEFKEAKDKIKKCFMADDYLRTMPVNYPIISCAIENANELGSFDVITHYVDFIYKKANKQKQFEMIDSDDSTLKAFMYNKEVERYIPEAIEKNAFEVFFQPIYNIKLNSFTSVEVLSRLQHPQLGYISPEIFIEISQKNEQISEIDRIQFVKTCQFLDENRELLNVLENIKFNVSPLDILKPGFCEKRIEIIKSYNLPIHIFQFEITETLATIYTDALYREVEKLKAVGIEICMDDFGSGYANLNTVLKMPFSAIKIDRSLLAGILDDTKKATLYQGTVAGFKNLGLQVICEGIESKEEYELLKSMNVDMIQGYYFSRPLSSEDLLKKLLNNPK